MRRSENHTAQGPYFHVLKETISWFQQMLLVLHRWCDLLLACPGHPLPGLRCWGRPGLAEGGLWWSRTIAGVCVHEGPVVPEPRGKVGAHGGCFSLGVLHGMMLVPHPCIPWTIGSPIALWVQAYSGKSLWCVFLQEERWNK